MIRRDITLADDTQRWSLISQVEHARLSGELAASWGNDRFDPVVGSTESDSTHDLMAVRKEVLAAITHHDDGWREWDAAPKMDPVERQPYSFTEMPLEDALDIWRASILACATIGPLAAWMVAGHFIELRSGSDTQTAQSDHWIDEMTTRRKQWLAEWQGVNPVSHTMGLAELALQWLRLFDLLSLWLCFRKCDPLQFPADSDTSILVAEPIRFVPQENGTNDELQTIYVRPWPFRTTTIDLAANSLLVPAYQYSDGIECTETAQREAIRWQLKPQIGSNDGIE